MGLLFQCRALNFLFVFRVLRRWPLYSSCCLRLGRSLDGRGARFANTHRGCSRRPWCAPPAARAFTSFVVALQEARGSKTSAHPEFPNRARADPSGPARKRALVVSALSRRPLHPAPGVRCQPFVVLGDAKHHPFRVRIRHLFRDAAGLLGSLLPVLGVIEDGIGHDRVHRQRWERNDIARVDVAQTGPPPCLRRKNVASMPKNA
jgi:hypothetical protein